MTADGLLALGLEAGSVPETMLVSLRGRASGAEGPRRLLDDPLAMAMVRRLDVDFTARFGRASVAAAVRARWCDRVLTRFLARHEDAVVVALGEGLETQFWRVDDGRVRWISVDLPPAIAARGRLLPAHRRLASLACSALDQAWMDAVPPGAPVFVSAAGLLMYFEPSQVVCLLRRVARRYGGGEMFFDTVPPWASRRSLTGLRLPSGGLRPAMPFGLALGDVGAFCARVGSVRVLDVATYGQAAPRGMPVSRALSLLPRFRAQLSPGLVHCALDGEAPV